MAHITKRNRSTRPQEDDEVSLTAIVSRTRFAWTRTHRTGDQLTPTVIARSLCGASTSARGPVEIGGDSTMWVGSAVLRILAGVIGAGRDENRRRVGARDADRLALEPGLRGLVRERPVALQVVSGALGQPDCDLRALLIEGLRLCAGAAAGEPG